MLGDYTTTAVGQIPLAVRPRRVIEGFGYLANQRFHGLQAIAWQ